MVCITILLAQFTGDPAWIDRYNRYLDPINTAIAEIQRLAPDLASTLQGTTDSANQALIVIEVGR